MKPYIIQSVTLTDYEGRTLHVDRLRDTAGRPIISRRPLLFAEDDIIAHFNRAFPGRLFTNAKIKTTPIWKEKISSNP